MTDQLRPIDGNGHVPHEDVARSHETLPNPSGIPSDNPGVQLGQLIYQVLGDIHDQLDRIEDKVDALGAAQ